MPRPFVLPVFALSLTTAIPVAAQTPTSLTRKTGAAAEPFSNATSLQELPDGRVLVADAQERVLSIVNFERGGEVKQLGRNGSGPNEYSSAQTLARGRGDTVLLLDFPARRVLRIAPNGTLAGTEVFELGASEPLPGEKPLGTRITSAPRFSDANGGLYFDVGYYEPSRGIDPERMLARWDPVTRQTKAMGKLNLWYPSKSTRWRAPFMYQDVWAVAPDGRVARVLPVDYHVEWYKDGALIARGAPVPYEPVRVTKEDRDAWYRARAAQRNVGSAQMSGPPPAPGSESKEQRPKVTRPPGFTDADFPDVKPPFIEDYVGRSMLVSSDGLVWVMRSSAFDAKTREVDVFDGAGKRVRRLSMPVTNRVAGVGKSSIYVIRTDDEGLQWLERYAR